MKMRVLKTRTLLRAYVGSIVVTISALLGANPAWGQEQARIEAAMANPTDAALATDVNIATEEPLSSVQQGQTLLSDSFELDRRQWRLEKRRGAFRDTQFKLNPRIYYYDLDDYDGSEKESLAIGGWAGFKTGYFLDHVSFGATVYTSQHLYGDDSRDGARLLKPGQEGYTVLGEAYVDIRIVEDLHLYVGRKEYDTPYINGHDNRMTPNTFEAITLHGRVKLGEDGGTFKYGLGYFDKIKERNLEDFVSMSEDAGANVERGVFSAGGLYQQGDFSIGAIDYYSPDIINIGYAEAKLAIPINEKWKPRFALQFTDQRSVGDDLLQGDSFSVQQVGVQAELPVGDALFTAAFTHNTDGAALREPWSGYPGYTSSQVEDFLRAGETAFLLRAAYEFPWIEGLNANLAWTHGLDPEGAEEYARDECDFDVKWAPSKGVLKGLSLRLRYAIVEQHGGNVDYLNEIRVIGNYAINF